MVWLNLNVARERVDMLAWQFSGIEAKGGVPWLWILVPTVTARINGSHREV